MEEITKRQNEIDRIAEKLHQAWKKAPDWRLGQVVSNLLGAGIQDVFHPSDETWEAALDEFIRTM